MTITFADTSEAVVSDTDPVKALMGAARDRLLTYSGAVSGRRYEVQIAGRPRMLPEADVRATVDRLRAIERLSAAVVAARLVDLREDDTHVLEVNGQLVELPADRVVDWCSGYAAAAAGRGQEHVGADQLAEIRALFTAPSRDDQCRMVILSLMHRPGEEISSTRELAERVDRAKKTVVDALGFGGYLASDLAERMIAAFGLRWSVTAAGGAVEPADGGQLAEPLPEMPGLARLRRILAAADAGWLRYVDEPGPNSARWNRNFRLAVGGQVYVVTSDGLPAWLDGVEAYHDVLG